MIICFFLPFYFVNIFKFCIRIKIVSDFFPWQRDFFCLKRNWNWRHKNGAQIRWKSISVWHLPNEQIKAKNREKKSRIYLKRARKKSEIKLILIWSFLLFGRYNLCFTYFCCYYCCCCFTWTFRFVLLMKTLKIVSGSDWITPQKNFCSFFFCIFFFGRTFTLAFNCYSNMQR